MNLGTPTGAAVGATPSQTVTLTDDDPLPTVNFNPASQSACENSGTAYVIAQLSKASGLVTTVPFTLGGTAVNGTNYTISGSSITIAAQPRAKSSNSSRRAKGIAMPPGYWCEGVT